MRYYDSQGNLVEFDGLKSGHYGYNSEIMKLSDGSVYKKYFQDTGEENRILIEVFEFIKQINNDHMVKLLERFYQAHNSIDAEDIKNHPEQYVIDAYTYEWVENDGTNVFNMPIDYLTDNLRDLLLFADILSSYGLYMIDVKMENIVLNKSGMVLIDPDIYTFASEVSYKRFDVVDVDFEVKKWNRKAIIELFKSLCCMELKHLEEMKSAEVVINELFEEVSWLEEYDPSIVSKKLSRFATPLEYARYATR